MSTTEERLATIEANTERILRALDGNGQPGLIPRMAQLETLSLVHTEDIKDLQQRPNRSGAVGGAVGGTFVTGLGGGILLLLQRLGVSIGG